MSIHVTQLSQTQWTSFTPVITNITNATIFTIKMANYQRVGAFIVIVDMVLEIMPTIQDINSFDVAMPIPSDLQKNQDVAMIAGSLQSVNFVPNTITLFVSGTAGILTRWQESFQYLIQ